MSITHGVEVKSMRMTIFVYMITQSWSWPSRFIGNWVDFGRQTPEKRYAHTFDGSGWPERDKDSMWLKQRMTNLVKDLGPFLETACFIRQFIIFAMVLRT